MNDSILKWEDPDADFTAEVFHSLHFLWVPGWFTFTWGQAV